MTLYSDYGGWIWSEGFDICIGYTGHCFHAPTQIQLAFYRSYSAELGRWLSRDPIGLAGGINEYNYVASNPTMLSDPLGLSFKVEGVGGMTDSDARDLWDKFRNWIADTCANAFIDQMDKDTYEYKVSIGPGQETGIARKGTETSWEPNTGFDDGEGNTISPATAIAHELAHAHAFHNDRPGQIDRLGPGSSDWAFDDLEERRVITEIEHCIAEKKGEGKRTNHGDRRKFPKARQFRAKSPFSNNRAAPRPYPDNGGPSGFDPFNFGW